MKPRLSSFQPQSSPALEAAIADAVVMAERIMAADRSQGGDATRSDYDFNAKYPWNTHGG